MCGLSAFVRAGQALVQARFMPPYLLVDDDFRILHISAAAKALLERPEQALPQSLDASPQEGLFATLHLIAEGALRHGRPVVLEDIALGRKNRPERFTLVAEGFATPFGRGAAILFRSPGETSGEDPARALDGFLGPLLEDTGLALLLLAPDLTVRSYTPALHTLLGFEAPPSGFPVSTVLGGLMGPGLDRDLRRAISNGLQIERPVDNGPLRDWIVKLVPVPAFGQGDRGQGVAMLFRRAHDRDFLQPGRPTAQQLNHRLKNILGTAIAIASTMLAEIPAMNGFRTAYVGRIRALADANVLVLQNDGAGVEIRVVIQQQLQPFLQASVPRVSIDGPILILCPRAAVSLAMAVHEMAANAASHGALADPAMTLAISWRRTAGTGGRVLVVEWVEEGATGLRPPAEKGLGITLIEQGIAYELSGRAEVKFADGGARYRIEIPEREALMEPS